MKKMQCEICGSNEIKKIDDGIFECQSCGVRYSKTEAKKLLVEITGEVKLDHSKDAENMVKRAKQFEECGNQEKAQEYYEKALDFDPENEEAAEATSQKHRFASDIVILEPDIPSIKAEEKFFHYLYNCNKLAPDFFANIKNLNITEKYYPFIIYYGNISGTFTGTSCYNRKVAYTDYENKQVRLNNGTYRMERVPVTKYRTDIEKRPANGQFSATAAGVYSISPNLNGKITNINAANIDNYHTDVNVIGNKSQCGAKMLVDFESLSLEIAQNMENRFTAFDRMEISEKDNKQFYRNFEIDLNFDDKSWAERAKQQYGEKVEEACRISAQKACPGDYCEDVSYVKTFNNSRTLTYYIPLQIIEYSYKGDSYVAIQILHTFFNKISATYPINKDEAILQVQLEKQTEEITKLSSAGKAGLGFSLGGIIFLGLGLLFSDISLLIIGIIALIVSLPLNIAERSNNKKKKDLLNEINEKMIKERRKVSGILDDTFRIFIEDFLKTQSFKSASSKAHSAVPSLQNSLKHSINFSGFSTPKIISTEHLKAISKEPSKVFIYIGKREALVGSVQITIDGEEQGIIKSEEHIAIDIKKDCTIDCKWKQSFTKVSIKAFVGQTKIVYLNYGLINLTVKEVIEDNRFDEFLKNGEMQKAISFYCSEYGVKEKEAITALEKRKIKL